MSWLKFFIGTPQRFLVTAGITAIIFFAINPEVLGRAITNLLSAIVNAVGPFAGPLLTIAIIIWAIEFLVRSAFPKKGGGKN